MARRVIPAQAGIPALEPISQDLYDTKFLPVGGITQLEFFKNPAPGEIFSNMQASGQLPHPQQFHAFGLACEIFPHPNNGDANGLAGISDVWAKDKKKIREMAFLRFHIGAKDYLTIPLVRVPEGLGLTGVGSGGVAGTVLAASQGIQDIKHSYEVTVPQRGKIKPIHIPAQQSFFVQIRWTTPTGTAAFSPPPDGWAIAVRVYLLGVLWREVQ